MRPLRQKTKTKRPAARSKEYSTQSSPVRRLVIIYALLVLFSAAAALAYVTQRADRPTDPFTSQQRAALAFQLYYPTSMPDGYEVKSVPAAVSDRTVQTLTLSNGSGGSILISQQAVPPEFDFDAFHGSFSDRTEVKTSHGNGMIGTIDGGRTRIGSLASKDGTWILVTADASTLTASNAETLLRSLKPSD